MTAYKIKIITLCGLFSLAACSKQAPAEEPASATTEASASTSPFVVTFTEAQQKVGTIELGTIENRPLSARVTANGQLQLPPQNIASINPLMGGVVRSIPVKEGEYVQKGKVLATIQNPELIKLQEEYLTTRNQLRFAEQDYERQRTLNEEQVGSRKRFEQAESDVQVQRARLKAIATHLSAMGISSKNVEAGQITSSVAITAPISGYVRVINVNMGTYAQPGQQMFELVDNHHLHLELSVFERDFSKMKEGQKVLFTLPNVAGEPLEAEIFALGRAFEGDSRMVTVHAELENNKNTNLLPGMYVNAQILAGKQELPALPEESVVRYKGKHYVFVKEGPTTFRMHEVETGVAEDGFTEVKTLIEFPAKAQVVTKGAYYVLAEKMKSEVAEE
ncbi:efflux RND transporter periplasmic adaptor subunit [Pontibacter sp. HSC-14F20]|uniref:efflux RND transporter periplasmic adaptor subunit n=1 Tax=Pontibacter sp. HSC-14F20 TaxID=2864136 RepID=UPI001C73A401|nr:efflux RND transporter periplasmic adaptor subunit [Pontibacter sp. HSC-14F20]MBX0334664.1 efflux RND transporter periplasmic adaptor subunit [Pontibacter sp. HSC-14F20]